MKTVLVSVIIPTRHAVATLNIAIDSILNQTLSDIEIFVVDDFSDDGTEELVREYAKHDRRLHYLQPDIDDDKRLWWGKDINAGYSARNAGLARVKSEWITFQDSDDISLLNRLEIQLSIARRHNIKHLTTGYFWLDEKQYQGKALDWRNYVKENEPVEMPTQEILENGKKYTGAFHRLPDWAFGTIPFSLKRRFPFRHLFFPKIGRDTGYPGTATCPFFHSSLLKGARFRPLGLRRFPSVRGRGADRDFNYQLALTSRSSLFVDIPLYGWRTPNAPPNATKAQKFEHYLIDA